jgi:pimeloyl-ACP methyl ester carboxylesterase
MNILFIHGMWSQPWVWADWKARFEAAGHRCEAITLPGHEAAIHTLPTRRERGAASRELGRLGVGEYTDAVGAAMARIDDGSGVVLVGHSMGGLLALMGATRFGQHARAVVSVNGAAPGNVFPLRAKTLPGTARHFANPILFRRGFRLGAREAGYLLFNAMPKERRREMAMRLVHESGRAAFQLAFGPLNFARSNRIDKTALRCPVLLLSGARDRIVPAGASRAGARWLGDQALYREYPNAAHWLLGEPGWEAVVDEVLAWLQKSAPQAPNMAA